MLKNTKLNLLGLIALALIAHTGASADDKANDKTIACTMTWGDQANENRDYDIPMEKSGMYYHGTMQGLVAKKDRGFLLSLRAIETNTQTFGVVIAELKHGDRDQDTGEYPNPVVESTTMALMTPVQEFNLVLRLNSIQKAGQEAPTVRVHCQVK